MDLSLYKTDRDARSEFKGVITVVVGQRKGKDQFTVHKDIICKRSPFFTAACSNNWKEEATNVIHLPDENAVVFKVYLQWAYFGTTDFSPMLLTTDDSNLIRPAMEDDLARMRLCEELCRLWILADYLGDTSCKNAVMNVLVSEHDKAPFLLPVKGVCDVVYARTESQSSLRRWMLDACAGWIEPSSLFHYRFFGLSKEMIVDIFEAFVNRAGPIHQTGSARHTDATAYHE